MTKMIVAALAMLISAQAFAGASNTSLDCSNKDGSVSLSGDVPGDFTEFTLTVTQGKGDKKKEFMKLYSVTNQTTYKTEENARLVIFEDLKNDVYALQADDLDGFQTIRLYAIPKTLNKNRSGVNVNSSFKGKLNVDSENGMIETEVNCKTDYSI